MMHVAGAKVRLRSGLPSQRRLDTRAAPSKAALDLQAMRTREGNADAIRRASGCGRSMQMGSSRMERGQSRHHHCTAALSPRRTMRHTTGQIHPPASQPRTASTHVSPTRASSPSRPGSSRHLAVWGSPKGRDQGLSPISLPLTSFLSLLPCLFLPPSFLLILKLHPPHAARFADLKTGSSTLRIVLLEEQRHSPDKSLFQSKPFPSKPILQHAALSVCHLW